MFCYNIEKERTLNIVFDEHFRISDVHGMDEKVYGGQTMSKRKLLTVILVAFVTTLMLACAIIFTACGNNETPGDGHNTEQGGENPDDGDEPGTNPGTDTDDDKDIVVTSVSLNKTSLTLEVGENYTLVVTVSPSNATDKSVTWSSTNSSVAAVSGGKVTAKSEGTTTITATAHNGKKASCTITVNESAPEAIEVTSVSLNKTSLTLEIGESETLTATVMPSNATDKSVTWTSSDQAVATVVNGKITAVGSGIATITATASNGKKASCTITVIEPAPEVIEVTSVSLNKTSLTLEIGESETLTATVMPSNATDKSVTWTSSDQAVATVANGKITAVGSGIATITATASNGKTAICKVTVNAAIPEITQVEGATIDGTDIFMLVDHMTDSVALLNKVTVSSGRWDLYSDILGQNRIPTKIAAGSNGKLQNGDNVFYIMLENENGDLAEVYTLTVYRSYAVAVNYYNHKDVLVHSDTAYTGYEYILNFDYTAPGYTFNCWTENGVTYRPRVLWNDMVLHAEMTANSYIVYLNTDGGTLTQPQVSVIYDAEYVLPVPEYQGYTFLGWYIDETQLTDKSGHSLFSWLYAEDSSVTAKWQINQYTVTAEYNEQAGSVTGTGNYDFGTKVTLKALAPNLGYTFSGWYHGSNCLTTETIYTFTLSAEDVNLTAKYDVNDEMSVFTFSSTPTACVITGIQDKSVTELIVPDYVTEIEEGAFSGCSSLTSITLPFVGKDASATAASGSTLFGYIFGANTFNGSISTRQYYAQNKYSTYYIPISLRNVTITGGAILYGAFYYCSELTNIVLPNDITAIGNYAFYHCENLAEITIPDAVTTINSYAFYFCSTLTSIIIPNAVTSLGASAFAGSGLTRLTIGNGVQTIEESTFSNCSGLIDVNIPNTVTAIGGLAFNNCTGLLRITIGDGVTTIGQRAFNSCRNLTSLIIPKNVVEIDNTAFINCGKLGSIEVDSDNSVYHSNNNCMIDTADRVLVLGCKNSILPQDDSVTSIGDFAFYSCDELTSLSIPDNITEIGNSAFYNCQKLSIITFSRNLSKIGSSAFAYCVNLMNIALPKSLNELGTSVFYNCTALTTVIFEGVLTNITDNMFNYCSNLTSVIIPKGVISIGRYAFNGCSNLTSITIPDSVSNIGYSAFKSCNSLASVYITDLDAWNAITFEDDTANPLYYGGTLYLNGEEVTE